MMLPAVVHAVVVIPVYVTVTSVIVERLYYREHRVVV